MPQSFTRQAISNSPKTIKQDIVATSDFAGHAAALEKLQESGKVRLTLHTEVHAGGELASRFEGLYVVRLNG